MQLERIDVGCKSGTYTAYRNAGRWNRTFWDGKAFGADRDPSGVVGLLITLVHFAVQAAGPLSAGETDSCFGDDSPDPEGHGKSEGAGERNGSSSHWSWRRDRGTSSELLHWTLWEGEIKGSYAKFPEHKRNDVALLLILLHWSRLSKISYIENM